MTEEFISEAIQPVAAPVPADEEDLPHVGVMGYGMGCEGADPSGSPDDCYGWHADREVGTRPRSAPRALPQPAQPSSTPLPRGRQMSAVSLLPSGPGPVPAAAGLRPLRSFDPCPLTSQDEASSSGCTKRGQVAGVSLGLRPPRAGGFG